MPIGFVFWLLMLLILIFGVGWRYHTFNNQMYGAYIVDFLLYICVGLVGFHAFGFPIHG